MADDQPRSTLPPRSRKRASKACLACRARKVRCDISQREGTCTNCSLDQQVCVVKPRPTRYRNSAQSNPSLRATLPTTIPSNVPQPSSQIPPPELLDQEPPYQPTNVEEILPDLDASIGLNTANHPDDPSDQSIRDLNWDSPAQSDTREGLQATPKSTDPHVMSSYYPFLKLNNLTQMAPDDINFLERQSCFRIPTQPALDELMREYFLHVHPSLPIINEGDFWDMYTNRDVVLGDHSRMSLFVFQAMLFAACSFVPQATIRKLGFTSTRSARAAYFRRAKLLFDFNGERDSVSVAQGALLLTYNASTRNHKILNTFWLSTAIQFAKDADAHRYHSNKSLKPERKSALKRLWWCCILRDRILPLGVRRPLSISSADFDFSLELLTKEDFDSEIFRSRVYDASTKASLVQLLLTLCDLAVSLTEVIMLIYPVNDAVCGSSTEQKARLSLNRIESCKGRLHSWFENATIAFPSPAGISDSHESVVLYTNLMYMYYYSALLAIHHYEVLVIITSSNLLKSHFNHMCQSKSRVEAAAAGITDNLKELVQLKLAKHLPISVVAYAALPLVLHVLDVKLSATESQSARKRRRLDIYTMTMKGLQAQYDGTDEVFEIIGKVVDYMSLEKSTQRRRSSNEHKYVFQDSDSPRLSSLEPKNPRRAVNDWGDVLLRQPSLYLRIALTMDLSLSKGQFPDDTDFPAALQSQNHIQTHFPLYRITMGEFENASRPTTDASETHQDTQYHNSAADYMVRGRGNGSSFTPAFSSAMSMTDRFVDAMSCPTTRMIGQSPLEDLGSPMCSGFVGDRMQENVDALFDHSTNWVDTMFLGDEWLISPETTRT
ncbi:uncharacterized protein BDZ99DRAFT_435984 [Mytilinidion resinicola]|uniref:Zn(2)-C6 fungal-type domain-containing protein n=1 Tax=Mytilinidion resinicola TaxID=574789 RepID=A0A6A6Z5N6_9PEZI|nr:uncharacterized protein BDZ99DRAFT_435984 [Mytilinidion resinicola]KAF2815567.1 hypothetical protein BDZ99DRAFT_435984 [Mytilinidion resinicola]